MTGKLTTHVLDTTCGLPAPNLTIELWLFDSSSGAKGLLKAITTNADGRTDAPLLEDKELKAGVYELMFFTGHYFAKRFDSLPKPMFLDRIPIQFGVADTAVHYHVPLLVSPYSYSTYRGS